MASENKECTQDEPSDGEEEFEIEPIDGGRYKTTFHVSRVYYAPIIGTGGKTRKRLENDTKTIIKVPKQPPDSNIVITGGSKQAVAAARQKVQMMALSYRKKQRFTHFLSIPMCTPEVKERFAQFKEQVLQNCQTEGVDESIFQTPEKLHLTLCIMVLTDSVECSEAIKVLESCKKDVIDPLMKGQPITVSLSGVDFMRNNPAKVNVLYAKVHADDILQTMADDIVNYCSNAGIVDKESERVKLHMTIMNTKFRWSRNKKSPEKTKTSRTFNSAPIVEMFKDFSFGEVTIDTVHLSSVAVVSPNGYYETTSEMSLYLQ